HARRLAQDGGDQDPPLAVEARHLAVVVGAVQKLALRLVHGGQLRQLFLDFLPHRERVNARVLAREASYVVVGTEILVQIGLELGRNLQAAFAIHRGWTISAQHPALPFTELQSTRFVPYFTFFSTSSH